MLRNALSSHSLHNIEAVVGNNTTTNSKGECIEACPISDTDLRGVVFGDPVMHVMDLYAKRVEVLAVAAVTCTGS